jgi:hypothetical protein
MDQQAFVHVQLGQDIRLCSIETYDSLLVDPAVLVKNNIAVSTEINQPENTLLT